LADTRALKPISQEWHDDRPAAGQELETAFERWGQYKGLAFCFGDWKYKG
jgi:hypothetical protein